LALIDQALIFDPDTNEISVALDTKGNPILVTGFLAVAQQLTLMILVRRGEFVIDPNLGTQVPDLIGGDGDAAVFLPFAYKDIKAAVDALIQMHSDLDQVIPLEDKERVIGIKGINVDQSKQDPSQVFIDVRLITADQQARNVAVPLR